MAFLFSFVSLIESRHTQMEIDKLFSKQLKLSIFFKTPYISAILHFLNYNFGHPTLLNTILITKTDRMEFF